MPEQKNGRLEYQAQSPDEAALTSAARNFGYVFKSRTAQTITLEVAGSEEVFLKIFAKLIPKICHILLNCYKTSKHMDSSYALNGFFFFFKDI